MTPAELIQFHRKAKGWTMRELSRQSGISTAFISKVEKGDGNPTISTLQSLLGAMGQTLTVTPINGVGIEDIPHAKPQNLANRVQALLDIATPATLEALATAFTVIAEAHPGQAGAFIESIGSEFLSMSYARSTGVSK